MPTGEFKPRGNIIRYNITLLQELIIKAQKDFITPLHLNVLKRAFKQNLKAEAMFN